MLHLNNLWFVIVAVFWVGFFFLEGFDFGVGMLHSFLGRTDGERRAIVNTIGPFWDGNEVWLVVAVAVIFSAFPAWYATMFSGFYLILFLTLIALMIRGVSFEYTRKSEDPTWRSAFRWTLTIGSLAIPFLLGMTLGDLLQGLPINSSHEYTGSFWNLLQPYGLYTGLTFVVTCLVLGVVFIVLKTEGPLHERAFRWAKVIGWVGFFVVWGFVTWSHVGLGRGFVPDVWEALAWLGALAVPVLIMGRLEGVPFICAGIAAAACVASIFGELYPNVMISSTSSANNLTITNAISPPYTLHVMSAVAAIMVPIILIYTAWGYHVYKQRLSTPRIDPTKLGHVQPAVSSETADVAPAAGDGADSVR